MYSTILFGSQEKPHHFFRTALEDTENTGAVIHFISGRIHEIGTVITAEKRTIITGSANSITEK